MNGTSNLQFWQEKHFFRQNRGGFTKKLREQKGGNLDISCDTFLQWTLDIVIQGQQQYIHNSPKSSLFRHGRNPVYGALISGTKMG